MAALCQGTEKGLWFANTMFIIGHRMHFPPPPPPPYRPSGERNN